MPHNSDDVIRFGEGLTLSGDFAGKPFILREWQKDIIRKIFDTRRPDGLRQYTDVGLWLPRKNAKTELAAALACFMLFCDPHQGEIMSAAGEREQAGILFRKLKGMIERNPQLLKRCRIIANSKRIINERTGTIFQSLSSADASLHGYNPSFVICDEVHIWKRRELYTALVTGSDTREERLVLTITTAGPYEPESLEWELYDYAKKVEAGAVKDPAYLPIIYEIKKGENWQDQKVWHRVNPALGDFRSLEAMQRMAERAKVNTRLENDFRRLYLNEHTQQVTRWLNMEKWQACKTGDDIPAGAVVYGGLDLAATTDIAAWCIAQVTEKGYRLRWRFFIPADRMREIEQADRVPYSQWVREGHVTATPGGTIDYNVIHAAILQDADRYCLEFCGYDPWNAQATATFLEAEGLQAVKINQSVSALTEPCRELERCVLDGTLEHNNNPVATFHAANVEVWTDGNGNIKPIRPKHGASAKKIDAIAAAVMAIKLAQTQDQGAFDSMDALWD